MKRRYLVCLYNNNLVITGKSLQLLHINTNHWICIFVNNANSEVEIYDSLYSTISLSLVDQVIDLLHTQSGKITFKSMEMQKQKGNSDCGVYAIAVATALCYQEDPTIICWNIESMRRHLLKCLEQSKMEPFPRIPDETSKKGKIKKL